VRDSLAYGDRDVCVSRVVDYSSLVVRGRIPLYWEIISPNNIYQLVFVIQIHRVFFVVLTKFLDVM